MVDLPGGCPQCSQSLKQQTTIFYYRALPDVIIHDSEFVCTNKHCRFRIDLSRDQHRLMLATMGVLVNKPTVLTRNDLEWLIEFLPICAGYDEKFAKYLDFGNSAFLKEFKIDLRFYLYLDKNADKDLTACVMPFWREAGDLMAQKIGFKNYQWLEKCLEKEKEISENDWRLLDQAIRGLMKQVVVPDWPRAEGQFAERRFMIHVYY